MLSIVLALGSLAAAAPPTVDLLRAFPGDAKIFVQATLPDGERAVFLVDTGADLSAISGEIAERLGLEIQRGIGELSGLSGSAPMNGAHLPSLDIGGARIEGLDVAVDIPGLQTEYAFMPIDGLLGNNVWSRFVLEIDYPADVMVLHPPGSVRLPRGRSEPLFSDGGHVWSSVVLHTGGDKAGVYEVQAVLDTGLRGFMHRGHTGESFEGAWTSEGIEPIYGLGAADTLPPDFFLSRTRRIPLTEVELGGARVPFEGHVKWLQYDTALLPPGLAAQTNIIGHEAFEKHTAFFDYGGRRFALRPSKRPARELQAHRILLDQDIARYGEDPTRSLFRAKMHIGLDDLERAETELGNAITWADAARQPAIAGEARVILGHLLRGDGRVADAWAAYQQVPVERLIEEEALVGMVNGLLLEGRLAEATRLADDAIHARPDDAWAAVARSDVALAAGDPETANRFLRRAVQLDRYPDAHLFRRARVALSTGDRDGALAMLRRIVQINPLQGKYLWFYGLIVAEDERSVFRSDLDRAIARMHPEDLPLDFLVASYDLLGDAETAQRYLAQGIARDCDSFTDEDLASSKDNCVAWYHTLAGVDVADALRRVDKALAAEGPRADFLDTKAMVHLRQGDYAAALEAARSAARLAPDDLYMLWQVQRLTQLAGAPAPAAPPPG